MVVYIDGLVNIDLIDRDILKPLKSDEFNGDIAFSINASLKEVDNIATFIGEVLDGNVAVFYDNMGKILSVDFKAWNKRSIETPDTEAVLRGPKEGFNENFRTNTSLIRRKIKTPKLIFETIVLGRQTNTKIALVYIDGIVNNDILKDLKYQLSKIDTDAILESGYIEQYIEVNYLSPVRTVGNTQKPDVLAGRILEGRIGIICDGTPHVLTVPHLFIENLQTAEDYYNRTLLSSLLRAIRIFSLFMGIVVPGLYVAITNYHHEMIPVTFMTTLITATLKTPLPAGAEVLFLIIMFELLKESGTRLPRTVGSAISIVGALIIGDAAVNAGIVGAPVVIVVALTAVSSFILPTLTEFQSIYRLLFLDMEDNYLRYPLWKMNFRPQAIAKDNIRRQKRIK
jgi:spore germination protein KA